MNEVPQILPCPFCGETPSRLNAHGFGSYSVSCDYCRCGTDQVRGIASAFAAWNKRDTRAADIITAERDRLKAALELHAADSAIDLRTIEYLRTRLGALAARHERCGAALEMASKLFPSIDDTRGSMERIDRVRDAARSALSPATPTDTKGE